MRHLDYLLAPGLMLADYFLTLLGASLYGTSAAARAAYELNPRLQNDVGRLRLFNPAHLGAVVALMVMLVMADSVDEQFARFFFGVLIGLFALVVGNHIVNIISLGARRLGRERAPTGRTSSYRFKLTAASAQAFGLGALPLSLFAILEPSAFALGVATGAWGLALAPLLWRLRSSREVLDKTDAFCRQNLCSFCGAGENIAKKLLAAEHAMICDECVNTCAEVLSADAAPAFSDAINPADGALIPSS